MKIKYEDIKKYTSSGKYDADTSFDHLNYKITEWLKEDKLQLNPDFQRGHVWTEKQQIAYIEYKLANGPGNDVIYFNQPGWMGDFKGAFVCVDGLQRITAIMKFCDGEIPAYGTYVDGFDVKVTRRIDVKININNLQTHAEVLKWYLELNGAGTPHTKEELQRVERLLENEKKT